MLGHSPVPVVSDSRRRVHSRLRAKLQNILHLDYNKIGNACIQRSYHAPDGAVAFSYVKISAYEFLCLFVEGLKPAESRVIVVSAYVRNTVCYIIMRHITAFVLFPECEFQYIHAGISAVCEHFVNLICKKSEVFRNKLYLAQFLFHSIEKLHSRTLQPFALFGGDTSGRNSIKALKSPEMVNSQDIKQLCRIAYALYPPLIAVLFHRIPVIKRIAPQLTRCGEIIGRAACNIGRTEILIKHEKRRLSPDIRAVH